MKEEFSNVTIDLMVSVLIQVSIDLESLRHVEHIWKTAIIFYVDRFVK